MHMCALVLTWGVPHSVSGSGRIVSSELNLGSLQSKAAVMCH